MAIVGLMNLHETLKANCTHNGPETVLTQISTNHDKAFLVASCKRLVGYLNPYFK